jgi:hypothetical protein
MYLQHPNERVEEKRRLGRSPHKTRGAIKTILEGAVEGKNARSRPRREYIGQILEDTGCPTYTALKRLAEDREGWRAAANQSQD